MKLLLVALGLLLVVERAPAYIYGRCEMAETLYYDYGYDRATLGDWVCLIQHESSYNTRATNTNTDSSQDNGLYQINDYYWCYSANNPTYNDCSVDCANLLDDNIDDDVACADIIYARHGFTAWYGWINYCDGEDVESYVSDCNVP